MKARIKEQFADHNIYIAESIKNIKQTSTTTSIENNLIKSSLLMNEQLLSIENKLNEIAPLLPSITSPLIHNFDYIQKQNQMYTIAKNSSIQIADSDMNIKNGLVKSMRIFIINTNLSEVSAIMPTTSGSVNTMRGNVNELFNSGMTQAIADEFYLFVPTASNTFPFPAPANTTITSYYVLNFIGNIKFSGQLSVELKNNSSSPISMWVSMLLMKVY